MLKEDYDAGEKGDLLWAANLAGDEVLLLFLYYFALWYWQRQVFHKRKALTSLSLSRPIGGNRSPWPLNQPFT